MDIPRNPWGFRGYLYKKNWTWDLRYASASKKHHWAIHFRTLCCCFAVFSNHQQMVLPQRVWPPPKAKLGSRPSNCSSSASNCWIGKILPNIVSSYFLEVLKEWIPKAWWDCWLPRTLGLPAAGFVHLAKPRCPIFQSPATIITWTLCEILTNLSVLAGGNGCQGGQSLGGELRHQPGEWPRSYMMLQTGVCLDDDDVFFNQDDLEREPLEASLSRAGVATLDKREGVRPSTANSSTFERVLVMKGLIFFAWESFKSLLVSSNILYLILTFSVWTDEKMRQIMQSISWFGNIFKKQIFSKTIFTAYILQSSPESHFQGFSPDSEKRSSSTVASVHGKMYLVSSWLEKQYGSGPL